MKFLSVFCVVLYFRCGDFFELHNNVLQSQYQNQGSIQFDSQRNIDSPSLNNGYNNFRESQTKARFMGRLNPEEAQANLRFEQSHIYPEYINSHQFNRIYEQPLSQQVNPKLESQYFQNPQELHSVYTNPQELHSVYRTPQELRSVYTNPQELHSVYPNLEERRFNDAQLARSEVNSGAQLQLQSSLSYAPQQQYKEPAQHILGINQEVKSVMYPHSINTQSINNGNISPIISNADTELELQGISPELIQSMITQNNMKLKTLDTVQPHVPLPNSYENVRNLENIGYIESRKPFYSGEYHSDQNIARFQSPSAEVLYDMKKALPYTIRNQQPPSISQDAINFKNIVPNTGRIEDIIRSTPPVKRYMIIHPSGRVEHVDDIENLTKTHPNYRMIKPQDVLKYINGKTMIPGLQVPQPEMTLPINNYQQISPKNQKQYSTVEQQINKMLPSQNLNTQINAEDTEAETSIVPSKSNVVVSKIPLPADVTSKKAISLPSSNSQQKVNNLLSKEISQNITSVKPRELTITHSLPIIKVQKISNIQRASENSTDNFPTQNQQQISLDVALSSESNKSGTDGISTQPQYEEEICTSEESSEDSREYDSSSSPVSEISSVVQVNGDNFDVTMSENSTPSHSSENVINNIEPLTQPDNTIEFSIGETNTLPDLYINREISQNINNNNESTTNVTEAIAPLISFLNETEVPINEQLSTNTSSTRREISSEGENITLSSVNTSDSGGFWFQPDDLFWENIKNSDDAQKFYFLFVPPKPSVIEKETKTTIYANGTTVEEISETRDLDGVPTVERTVKVSHANSTVVDV